MTIATQGDVVSYDDGSPSPGNKSTAKIVVAVNPDGTPLNRGAAEYETVAASQTDQVLGATGAAGDYLEGLIVVVATAATAAVSIKDGGGSAISVFPNSPGGGVGTYPVPIGLTSLAGAWKVTTGAGVSVIAVGNFT